VDSLYCVADRLWHLVLPAATLGLVGAAGTARFQRAAMLEVHRRISCDGAGQGLPERRVVLRHELRNALLTFITRFGLAFPFLLTGAVLIETIYAWPGMGRLAYDAILSRDIRSSPRPLWSRASSSSRATCWPMFSWASPIRACASARIRTSC